MPSYRVKSPDGRTFTVNAPEGATQDQILAFARKNMPAAKPSGGTGVIGAMNRFVSTGNEMVIGAAEGAYNAASAITDPLISKIDSLIRSPEKAAATLKRVNQQRRSVSDAASHVFVSDPNPVARTVGRIGGGLAVPLPGKKLQYGGRIAKAAYRGLQGYVAGAAVRDVDENATEPGVTGAVANVVLPPVLSRVVQSRPAQAVGRAIERYGAPVMSTVDNAVDTALSRYGGAPVSRGTPMAVESMSRPLAALGKKAEARAARFKAVGVNEPTTGMVTRDPNAFSFERNTAKITDVGEDLQQQIQNVEASLTAKGQELVRTAGGAKGPEATGKAVQDALDSKRSEMQKVTGKLYEQVRETRGDAPVGELGGLRGQLDHPDMVDNAVFDQMRSSLARRMERLGTTDSMSDLPGPPGVTIKQAEELRKFIGGLGDGREPAVRMMRGRLIESLDDDVVDSVGDDAFKSARASAKARFEEFGKTFAGKIADEGIAPEALTKRVLSDTMRLSDLRAMRQSLHTGTDDQIARGKEAWQSLRGQALGDFLSGATDANGQFMGSKLAKDFAKQAPKFRELLDPADYKMLHRLVNATRDAKVAPAQSSVNHSNTATTMANMFQSLRPATRKGWLKLLAANGMSHVAAWSVAGPSGNLALWGAKTVIGGVAETKAANELLKRVQLARSPEETAKAIKALRDAAKINPAIAKLLNERPIAGAVAASQE